MMSRHIIPATVLTAAMTILSFAAVPAYGSLVLTSGSTTWTTSDAVFSCTKNSILDPAHICKDTSLVEHVALEIENTLGNGVVALGGKWDEKNTNLICDDNKCPNFVVMGDQTSGDWWFSAGWDDIVKYIVATVRQTSYVFNVTGYTHGKYSMTAGGDITNLGGYGVVPLPAAVWLFLSGLGVLGFLRHGFRRAATA